jgi:uncharacterized protein (TIGR03382 family)
VIRGGGSVRGGTCAHAGPPVVGPWAILVAVAARRPRKERR